MKKLEQVRSQIITCTKCRLSETRTNAVPGNGPENAEIMLVGQAPGREEDKQGKPFVGRAGKFLTEILHSIGINRKDVFITSPVRCFPPKNRKPKKDELKACRPYLEAYVSIIKPKIIVLMGEIAFNSFFPDKKLKSFRGKWLEKKNIKFLITYHPASGMRFPKLKEIIKNDFNQLKIKS
jgi:DNA polymerase